MSEQDQALQCVEKDCGAAFIFTVSEQKFYADNGFSSPKRCRACRDRKKAVSVPVK
jgi:hypothetical protein